MTAPTPLRIVHVLRAPMGGLFRHVRDLALAHEAAGHSVGVVCDTPGTPGYNEAMASELAGKLSLGLKRVDMRREVGFADLRAAGKTLNVLKELQPNVLHGHGAKGGVYARALGSLIRVGRSRVARFYSPHGGSLHFDPESRKGRLYFRIERLLERTTDEIIFVSEFERALYERKIGTPQCGWSVNFNGLTEQEFEHVTPDAGAADFLYLGEMRMLKGPDLFLGALARLRDEESADRRAVMVGDGPDRDHIAAMISDLGLAETVSLRPSMPARAAFRLGRIFVMPSRAEAMPYVVLEALAAGKPVIATDVGGIPEIFGDAAPALVRPETDALAAAMREAAADPAALNRKMPDRGTFRARFSVETMAGNVLASYRRAMT